MEKRKDIHLEKFKSASVTILLCFIGLWAYSYDYLQVSPVEVYFNYEAGHTRDAVTISDDGTAIVNDPEWEDWCGEKHKFAYIKSQSNRSIKVRLSGGSYSGLMHLLIKVSYVSGHIDGIGTVCNLFVSNFNTDSLLTLYPTGDFPLSVGVHEFQWRWEIYAIPVNNSNYCAAWDTTYSSHHFYTLLAAPLAPMAQPWERVLGYACVWAIGQDNIYSIAEKVTEGIYYMGDLDGDIDYSLGSSYCLEYYKFRLINFLNDVKFRNNVLVNCTDCANLLNIFSASLGCQANSRRIWSGLNTNQIDPLGSTFGWTSVYWDYHHYGWIDSLVNDASIRLYQNQVAIIPSNMSLNVYNPLLILGIVPIYSQIYTTEIVQ